MIGLIIIGDEILSGRRQDKHLSKAIELLSERGMAVSWVRYVGDEPDRVVADLRYAFDSGDVVFSFGGIGATPDDHTRACAGRALGRELVLHPQAKELILARCREMAQQDGTPFDPDSADTQRRLQMGVFPVGADIIPNPYNRIPGFSLEGRVHFLPGFPVMAWPMMAWVLDELHADLHGQGQLTEKAVVVYGAIESVLTPLMLDIESRFAPVKVFSLPSVDHPVHGRHIELGVKGDAKAVETAFEYLLQGLSKLGAPVGPILVRNAV
ncbi:MAG: competence/damage-inducible protein A [Aquabacterium sp.]|uniref:competence/damage-inducible protein A n=1 Tax=Aquabacterium sp. TaxID=1872578 RepID=UPI00121CC6A8|nr:molybdopterin-binding protein [Aquabacterium sp.]TAK94158.1 MAG: competence/damage-inducible protein A [Aquabacterium sp.]